MLKIMNDLRPFFEDCYRRVHVREYAKLMGVSPPTASKLLSSYRKEGLLVMEKDKNYMLFHANRESEDFIGLSRIYWGMRLRELTEFMERKLADPTIVLFGSLSKAEAKKDSDMDIAVFAEKKDLNTTTFEKKLGRQIQILWFRSIKDMKNRELANNILNGYVLRGRLGL